MTFEDAESLPVPEHIQKHIEAEHNLEIAELFNEEAISRLSLADFAKRIR